MRIPLILFFLIFATSAYGARTFKTAPIIISQIMKPGYCLQSVTNPDCVALAGSFLQSQLFFIKVISLSLKNISTQAQNVIVEAHLENASWRSSDPAVTNTPAILFRFGSAANQSYVGTKLISASTSLTIAAGATRNYEALVMYLGPAPLGSHGAHWRAAGVVAFTIQVNEDRGAISGNILVSSSYSHSGNNILISAHNLLESAMLSASYSPANIQVNGGRPF